MPGLSRIIGGRVGSQIIFFLLALRKNTSEKRLVNLHKILHAKKPLKKPDDDCVCSVDSENYTNVYIEYLKKYYINLLFQ